MLGDPIEEKRKPKSAIMECICDHEVQDQWYGRGKRLHNAYGGQSSSGWRCTVCGKER